MGWLFNMTGRLGTLVMVVCWFAVGTYFFTSGFLLTRHEINIKSSCNNAEVNSSAATTSNTCWTVPEVSRVYSKVIVIIIDALRVDFAYYQPNSTKNLPYINKLKVFHDLATEHGCESTRLFKFRADAPTTTMQRIKGITTGSFPTFIDVSNNFDSSEITEDNFIDQILSSGNENVTFMGDDTWMNLFPGRFTPAFPFPSFDVKDLHLVDNGIIEHLVPELKKGKWKMLIAHFLGVDHCGHRYGPLHPEMSKKLQQLDSVLRTVVEAMDNDSLLLVMGDHGMTQTGDHGGETLEEVDAALFAFSKRQKFSNSNSVTSYNCDAGLVHQVDLVPTLSFLLGLPIPFSNLGSVIIDLIPNSLDSDSNNIPSQTDQSLAKVLYANAKQIEVYLQEYNERYNNFNTPEFHELIDSFQKLTIDDSKNTKYMLGLLRKARNLCKEVWAQFNIGLMLMGISYFVTMLMWLLQHEFSARNVILLVCLSFVHFLLYPSGIHYFQIAALIVVFVVTGLNVLNLAWKGVISTISIICMIYPVIYTLNSFVLNEDSISLFLYISAIVWLLIQAFKAGYNQNSQNDSKRATKFSWKLRKIIPTLMSKPTTLFAVISVFLMTLVRVTYMFRICRPEQFWCFNTDKLPADNTYEDSNAAPLYYIDGLIDFNNSWSRFFISGGSLVAILFIFAFRLKSEGNLRNTFSAAVMCSTKLLPLCVVCVILNWQLQTLPAKELDELPSLHVTFLPRCAFALLLVSLLWWLAAPLTVHLMYMDRFGQYRDDANEITEKQAVLHYYHLLKKQLDSTQSLKKRNKNGPETIETPSPLQDQAPPAAFGLLTFVSASVLGLGEVVIVLLAMLLEEKYAPVLLMFVISTAALLELVSAMQHRLGKKVDPVSWDVVGIWMLSSSFWWFATGHQPSLSSIPWNAAFVGFQGSHPTVILPALMVGANIFASQILHSLFLPLLILWPITRGTWFSKSASNKKRNPCDEDSDHAKDAVSISNRYQSELDFFQSPKFWSSFSDLYSKHILLHALKLLGCMSAAFIHRRHLMVWQIFAPRFVFEALSFFVVCITSLLSYLFIGRLSYALDSWIVKVNKSVNRFPN